MSVSWLVLGEVSTGKISISYSRDLAYDFVRPNVLRHKCTVERPHSGEEAYTKGRETQAEIIFRGALGRSWATCESKSRTRATWRAILALAYTVDGVAVPGRRTAYNK